MQQWPDEEIIAHVLAGESPLYEVLVRRYNQRLYRVVRAVLRDDAEAEDVMQEAYFRAYQHLADFEGRSTFSTWLIKIGVHEALARRRRSARMIPSDLEAGCISEESLLSDNKGSPDMQVADAETRGILEQAILALPARYRTVLMMRDVEELSTADTAAALNLTEENVKVRLHRARALVRRELYQLAGATSASAFQFHAVRCDRVAGAVMQRIAAGGRSHA
jgi:RNA polymerase sigma-70 factor (ECF subfamily)